MTWSRVTAAPRPRAICPANATARSMYRLPPLQIKTRVIVVLLPATDKTGGLISLIILYDLEDIQNEPRAALRTAPITTRPYWASSARLTISSLGSSHFLT